MIISASYKTDIPTFYGEWFMNRLRAGSCKMLNPYNRQVYTIDLTPGSVDGIIFWTKNIGPFLASLKEVQDRGYCFIIQHTITGYPRELEERVVNANQTIEHLHTVADLYGPDRIVWRYDPIVISSLTDFEWHKQNFAELAKNLAGTTNEVVVSLAQTYQKTKRNMNAVSRASSFQWQETENIPDDEIEPLLKELANIAQQNNMQMKACSQKRLLVHGLIEEARCIDAERLGKLIGRPLTQAVKQGNRKECGCFASKDIGEYDTCPHGCIYCYAVQRREKALERYKNHDPNSEFLFLPDKAIQNERPIVLKQIENTDRNLPTQGKLFP